jgi:signal transduction histidine kinase
MQFEAVTSSSNAAGLIPPKHNHVVQFYENDQFLYDAVTAFVGGALTLGQPAVVIARPESARGLTSGLVRSGHDVNRAQYDGQLIIKDARTTLSQFMRGSIVDEERFTKVVGGVIEQGLQGRDVVMRAFGEMVDILFRDGNTAAAIRLEELWNGLSHRYPFDLLCGYAIGNFYTDRHAEQLRDICDRHTHVVPAESYSLLQREDQRARAVIELQQRARALEIEIEHRKAVEHALRDALAERQEAILEAQRASAAKSEFLAVISHELRTPLTAILGYEDLIASGVGGPVTEKQQAFLGGIRSGADQLLRLIDQILTQSRMAAGKERVEVADVDLTGLLRSCVALVSPAAEEKHLEMVMSAPAATTVRTDAGKVQQVMLNLLSNAVKFTPAGRIYVRVTEQDTSVRTEVIDTGIGISASDLERIFEPFEQVDSTTTRQYSGIGLGLAVCRNLTHLVGGELTAESQPGMGSTFRLELPKIR